MRNSLKSSMQVLFLKYHMHSVNVYKLLYYESLFFTNIHPSKWGRQWKRSWIVEEVVNNKNLLLDKFFHKASATKFEQPYL